MLSRDTLTSDCRDRAVLGKGVLAPKVIPDTSAHMTLNARQTQRVLNCHYAAKLPLLGPIHASTIFIAVIIVPTVSHTAPPESSNKVLKPAGEGIHQAPPVPLYVAHRETSAVNQRHKMKGMAKQSQVHDPLRQFSVLTSHQWG